MGMQYWTTAELYFMGSIDDLLFIGTAFKIIPDIKEIVKMELFLK